MPRLPTLDDLGSRPVPVSNRRIATNPAAGVIGGGLERFGGSIAKAGGEMLEQQDKIAYAVSKSALLAADLDAREELQSDPDFATREQRYTQRMTAARDTASKMIKSRSDRLLFEVDAKASIARGIDEVRKSAFARRSSHEVALAQDTLERMADTGLRAPDDATREAVIGSASALIRGLEERGYIDAVKAGELRRNWTENYVQQRYEILKAIGDLDGAGRWLEANRSRLSAATEIRLTRQHHDAAENRENLTVAAQLVGEAPGTVSTTDKAGLVAQMVPITIHSESRNNPNAVSPKGARGRMQVMPGTGRDPGFGIKPWDGTDADNVRFGTEYLGKMMSRYGNDPAKAWAAYNAGPGTLDAAIRDHGSNWLANMPAETRAYVAKNLKALGGAAGGPVPDIGTVNDRIEAVGKGWSIERREAVKDIAASMIRRRASEVAQREDAAFESALAKADTLGAGFTDVSQLGDAFYRASVADQHRLRGMADANRKSAAKGPDANGDVIRSLKVMSASADVRDVSKFAGLDLRTYRPFMTESEFEDIAVAQQRAKNEVEKGPNAWNPRTGIQGAMTWGEKFGGVKLQDDDRYRVYRYMEVRAREWSAANAGKPPSENEYQSFFREATREVKFTRSFMGIDVLAPDVKQRAYEGLSQNYRNMIVRQFRAVNGRAPSEAEIEQWFERMGEALK